jgi:hypothetical protein
MPVYFVYPETDGTLTLWGHSWVDRIDNEPDEYPPIYFKSFSPLPQGKWIRGLRGEEITGNKWRQGHFRYLEEKYEKYLASLVGGGSRNTVLAREKHDTVGVELRRDIREKLGEIAETEGRDVKDLIREAIARLIRERS